MMPDNGKQDHDCFGIGDGGSAGNGVSLRDLFFVHFIGIRKVDKYAIMFFTIYTRTPPEMVKKRLRRKSKKFFRAVYLKDQQMKLQLNE